MAKKKSFTDIMELLSEVELTADNLHDLWAVMERIPGYAPAFKAGLMSVHELLELLEVAISKSKSEGVWEQADR